MVFPKIIEIERVLPDGSKIIVRYREDAQDDNQRFGPYTSVTGEVVEKDDVPKLLKHLGIDRSRVALLDYVGKERGEPDPEPIYGTEEQPYHGTDLEFMAREAVRESDFEKNWGRPYRKKMEDTTSTDASDRRVPVIYRRQELPTGNPAIDKNLPPPEIVRVQEGEVPFGYESIVPAPKVRVAPVFDEKIADTDEEVLKEAEALKEARRRRRNE